MKNNKDIVILYIEDVEKVLESKMKFILSTWGMSSRGARSLERASEILEDETFLPDLAIIDRGILRHEGDMVDDEMAGDHIYYKLWQRGIPTAVISGHDLKHTEPYFSKPPKLGFYSKPILNEYLCEAVEAYKRLQRMES